MKKLELIAKIGSLPFPPQVRKLLYNMVLSMEAVTSMGVAWGLGALDHGIGADEINRVVRSTLTHLSEIHVLSLRYALNDLEVPDDLRTMYMGYLVQCCLGADEGTVASIFEEVGVLKDLLSTTHISRVDQPERPDIVTKPH